MKYMASMFVAGSEAWRRAVKVDDCRIKLQQCAAGEIDLTPMQFKSIELLLRKTIPDLKAVEHHHSERTKTAQDYSDEEIITLLKRAGARQPRVRADKADRGERVAADVCGVHDATLGGGKDTPRH